MILREMSANCPLQQGGWWTADTTRGITLDEDCLGNVYLDVGVGGPSGSYKTNKPRAVMLVKNASGGVLSRNLCVTFDDETLEFMRYIDAVGGANERIAGVVEDGYTAGVPDGAIFRLVIEGEHYCIYHGSTDTQVATIPGEPLVCAGSGKVYGQDAGVAAGAATFAQVNGVMGYAMEVTVNDATAWDINKLIFVKSYFV